MLKGNLLRPQEHSVHIKKDKTHVTDRCENTKNGISQDWFQHNSHLIDIKLSVGTAAKQGSKETEDRSL